MVSGIILDSDEADPIEWLFQPRSTLHKGATVYTNLVSQHLIRPADTSIFQSVFGSTRNVSKTAVGGG